MNYKCPNCGGSVMFDAELGRMKCSQCGKSETDDLYYDSDYIEADMAGFPDASDAYMETKIYKCTSCGAKLMINGDEVSTFCAYCGHPTIVFDRVSKEHKPDCIIPFRINEEQAVSLIKQKFGAGRYIPAEVKKLQIDKIRGIYIPYWLYSTYIREEANITGSVGEGKQKTTVKLYRKAECNYECISLDASRKLNDNISIRLEPYDMRSLKPFTPAYMSGFYADRYDVEKEEVRDMAYLRTKSFMEESLLDSCAANELRISESNIEEFAVEGIRYALLPAWFMTFWYEGALYTILVNGQTGKVVGDAPMDNAKAKTDAALLLIISVAALVIASIFFSSVWNTVYDGKSKSRIIQLYGLIVLACFTRFGTNLKKYRQYHMDKKRLQSNVTLGYVKERQDKTWIR